MSRWGNVHKKIHKKAETFVNVRWSGNHLFIVSLNELELLPLLDDDHKLTFSHFQAYCGPLSCTMQLNQMTLKPSTLVALVILFVFKLRECWKLNKLCFLDIWLLRNTLIITALLNSDYILTDSYISKQNLTQHEYSSLYDTCLCSHKSTRTSTYHLFMP